MSSRTLIMGDWSRVIRDPIDLLRAMFFVGAAVFAIMGDSAGWPTCWSAARRCSWRAR
jgi:hypothetical protein